MGQSKCKFKCLSHPCLRQSKRFIQIWENVPGYETISTGHKWTLVMVSLDKRLKKWRNMQTWYTKSNQIAQHDLPYLTFLLILQKEMNMLCSTSRLKRKKKQLFQCYQIPSLKGSVYIKCAVTMFLAISYQVKIWESK